MTKKIGRNDPCPCGSGKKYKNCCLRKEKPDFDLSHHQSALPLAKLDAPKIKAYFEAHDSDEIFDYLIALQLNPANHGKNMRIERMMQLAVYTMDKGKEAIDTNTLKKLIDEEFADDVMEDIPMNMFCENVLFYGGNYPFFPGLSTHVEELFCVMTESIYANNDVFPEEFLKVVMHGTTFLLELGKAIALRAGLSETIRGNDTRRDLITDPTTLGPFGLPEEKIYQLFSSYGIKKEDINNFVIDKNDPHLLAEDLDENPLLYKPVVKHDGLYYLLGISNQGAAINNFILKQAIKYGCLNELVKRTQNTIWIRICGYCSKKMHWHAIPMNQVINGNPNYDEALFEIDTNWLAYVVYAKDSEQDVSVDGTNKLVRWDADSHIRTTLSTLRKDTKIKDHHILTFVLYSSMGESFLLTMNNQTGTDYLLNFSAFEFLQLVQTEKWDSLSLVRYARTKENMTSFRYARNQSIDCYSLFAQNGESFYLSDKQRPDILQLEPNEGYDLIKMSKEKLNRHGAMMLIDGSYAFVPVQRDMNYAEIYYPVDETIKAKYCNSYHVPLWVRCNQQEKRGDNPSSFIDTTITAIAFWMEAMAPSLDTIISKYYWKTVDIELILCEDVFIEKDFHQDKYESKGDGRLETTKTPNGVSIIIDRDYLRTFMGGNNDSEREMMKAIIMPLVDMAEDDAQRIIDEKIPLGQAKMILMVDPSQIPLTYPMWLYPPIYIHRASEQLLLDNVPAWMKEKGKDIEGKLATKEEKVLFLHNAVDILLEKVIESVAKYNTSELIIRLIHNHETLVYLREHNKMLNPAQILCFGESEEKRKEFFDDEQRLADSGLATRALIEYLSATQYNEGTELAGSDDIETILAIMSEVINLGSICDAINLDISDHIITKLSSGRYGIYDDGFIDNLGGFASARSVETVNAAIEGFAKRMEQLSDTNNPAKERDAFNDTIDEAFLSDWGVTYTNILHFLYASYLLAVKERTSVMDIDEEELIKKIMEIDPEMKEHSANLCLERLSLNKREDYLTPPECYDGKDIFPWCYNRELSFLRRPYVRYQMPDGCIHCIFGFRSCLQAGLQLADLLYSGRLKKGGEKIRKLLGYYENEKGKEFNEEVRAFLTRIPGLKVWAYDVSIKCKGNLVADNDYGDIDVMAYYAATNTLYSIECKNTNTAKNIREMKTEMDDYLGRGDNPDRDRKKALVLKHLRRHRWLVEHLEQVKKLVGAEAFPIIKSMMLTSEVIPTSYLRKEDTPLSILNFGGLKLGGLEYLNGCKEPDGKWVD